MIKRISFLLNLLLAGNTHYKLTGHQSFLCMDCMNDTQKNDQLMWAQATGDVNPPEAKTIH